jgi:large subunit ribosomal protein L16
MGSGKGAQDHWVAVVKRGRIMFELGDVTEEMAKEASRLASNKLPLETKFIVRPVAVVESETSGDEEGRES